MAAKCEQLLARFGIRRRTAEMDLGVRMRSTVFALFGLTTASCLVVVAMLAHQGVPFLPSLPLPGLGGGEEQSAAIADGEAVDTPAETTLALAGDRPGASNPAVGRGASAGQGGPRGIHNASSVVPPGPASVAPPASSGPSDVSVPVQESPGPADAPPVSAPAPAPSSTPVSEPASTAGSPTDSQLSKGSSKGKADKGSSGKSGSTTSKAAGDTDAGAPASPKAPSHAPVSTPVVPPATDAEPEPATDADPDGGSGHGHWK